MYVRGGYNVYPVEVEAELSTHPAVGAIAVGTARRSGDGRDRGRGGRGSGPEAPSDVGRPPPARRLGGLAAYKLPDDLRVVDSLPMTAMDKLDRRALGAARDLGA